MSKRITKAVRAAFNEQIATMKRNEEAAGLWCICGHSSPTHDSGFTCQSVACDCLNFRPSNADTWCQCGHSKYNHGEDDFSSQECNVIGCDCDDFTCVNEPPAPRAGERDEWRVMNFTKDGANEWMVVTGIGRTVALANTSDTRQAEREMRQIATEHNQYATLIGQRERLLATLQKLAAFDDAGGNMVLRKQGDYSGFDEPGAVRLARELLATIEREGV